MNLAEKFYISLLDLFLKKRIPFMVGGTYAFTQYTTIDRPTKDMDIFTTKEVYPTLLQAAVHAGYSTELLDEHWIAKIHKDNFLTDVIFAEKNGLTNVDTNWFSRSREGEVLGKKVKLLPVEDMIKSKAYIQNRNRYDGPDVIHLILRQGKNIDWELLVKKMEPNWEILFAHLLNFIFVFPSDRFVIPKWVIKNFDQRMQKLFNGMHSTDKLTRGLLLSSHYKISIEKWGYKDISSKRNA